MGRGVLVLGAGGHGKVVADILLSRGVDVAGFLDDDPTRAGASHFELPVLGTMASWHEHDCAGLALGIGSCAARLAVARRFKDVPPDVWVCAVHPSAAVASSVQLGRGVVVAAGAVINPDSRIGDFAIVNTGATVDHDCEVGDYALVAPGTHLGGQVRIGTGALIGIGAAILPGRTVGAWTTVGAGAVVVSDLPPNCTAIGVPAHVMNRRERPQQLAS